MSLGLVPAIRIRVYVGVDPDSPFKGGEIVTKWARETFPTGATVTGGTGIWENLTEPAYVVESVIQDGVQHPDLGTGLEERVQRLLETLGQSSVLVTVDRISAVFMILDGGDPEIANDGGETIIPPAWEDPCGYCGRPKGDHPILGDDGEAHEWRTWNE